MVRMVGALAVTISCLGLTTHLWRPMQGPPSRFAADIQVGAPTRVGAQPQSAPRGHPPPGGSDGVTEAAARAAFDKALRERMHDAIGAQFTVSFEGPAEAALAEEALQSLDRAYWRIGEELGTLPSDPIPVVLYTADQFRDITRAPAWAAGAYDGTIRVPMRGALKDRRELDRVLAHEFTHALIRTLASRNVPAWLNEGLAAALETGDMAWTEAYTDAMRRVPLKALAAGFGKFTGPQAALAYAASARAARRLLDEAGGFAVANLLRDLGGGESFETAFAHRIQRTFEDFQAELASS